MPVIALTANAFREDVDKCKAAGMDDFISKPVTLDRLAGVLSKWLNAGAPVPAAEEVLSDGDDQAVVDLCVLAELMGSEDEHALTEILKEFLPAALVSFESVKAAATANDPRELRGAAHGAKGEARNAGANALGHLYARIERGAESVTSSELDALIARTEIEVARVEHFIRARLGEAVS